VRVARGLAVGWEHFVNPHMAKHFRHNAMVIRENAKKAANDE